MIDRRTFVIATGAALLAPPLRAADRRAGGPPYIGMLSPGGIDYLEAAFLQGMRERGYVDGRNLAIVRRSADGDFKRLAALAAELVALKPDVIVTFVTAASIAVSRATPTVPIVFAAVGDPVVAGLVGNLARPGGNVTGTSGQSNAIVGKQVELIQQILPSASRLTTLWNPSNAVFSQMVLGEGLIAASRLRVSVRILEARNPDEIDRAFEMVKAEPPDAVLVMQDPVFVANATRITAAALALRLPAFGGNRRFAEAGMLASYGPDLADLARRSAGYVQKILKGAKPGDLAVELPTKFELLVNRNTAEALRIAIPASVLARAEVVG